MNVFSDIKTQYEEDLQQMRDFQNYEDDMWKFRPDELKWLRDNNCDHLLFVWGYWQETPKGKRNYEDMTQNSHAEGGRMLQEYTDVLFRVLYHVLRNNHDRIFPTDAMPKICSQSGNTMEMLATPSMRVTIEQLLSMYLHEDGIEELLGKLAGRSMLVASAAFACLIYTARQIFLLSKCTFEYKKVDESANVWYKRLLELDE